jgi:mono/diheme cytochrome c family protein
MNATRLVLVCLGVASLAAGALAQQPNPLAHADPAAGKALVQKDCVGCHEKRFGDTAAIYTRPDRRVHTPAQLLAQVQFCNTQLKSNYFPEDEANVAAYLNQQYYKFKP